MTLDMIMYVCVCVLYVKLGVKNGSILKAMWDTVLLTHNLMIHLSFTTIKILLTLQFQ